MYIGEVYMKVSASGRPGIDILDMVMVHGLLSNGFENHWLP